MHMSFLNLEMPRQYLEARATPTPFFHNFAENREEVIVALERSPETKEKIIPGNFNEILFNMCAGKACKTRQGTYLMVLNSTLI